MLSFQFFLLVLILAGGRWVYRRVTRPALRILSQYVKPMGSSLPTGYSWMVGTREKKPPDSYTNGHRLRIWLQNLDDAAVTETRLRLRAQGACQITAVHANTGQGRFKAEVYAPGIAKERGLTETPEEWVIDCDAGLRPFSTWRMEVYCEGVPDLDIEMFGAVVSLGTANTTHRVGHSCRWPTWFLVGGVPIFLSIMAIVYQTAWKDLESWPFWLGAGGCIVATSLWAEVLLRLQENDAVRVMSGVAGMGEGMFIDGGKENRAPEAWREP
jgi:hypothetical protein